MSGIHGVVVNHDDISADLVSGLRDDHMVRFAPPPRTVMINPEGPEDHWLVVDSTYPAQMQNRLDLLTCRRDWIMARLPGDDVRAAENELRDTIVSYMTRTYPDYFQRRDDIVTSPLTGISVDVGPYGADPLVATLLLASEDLLVMVPDGQDAKGNTLYPLKTGVLAFPNGWSLTSQFNQPEPDLTHMSVRRAWREAKADSLEAARLGKTTYQIHNGHVRHFMENFATRVDIFFTKMPPSVMYWRRNWSPAVSPALFRHADTDFPPSPPFVPELWAERGLVRSEHETFLKLPVSQSVVFGIKTYLWPLGEMVAKPAVLNALMTAFNSMEKTPAMYEYRAETLPSFGEYLHRCAGPAIK